MITTIQIPTQTVRLLQSHKEQLALFSGNTLFIQTTGLECYFEAVENCDISFAFVIPKDISLFDAKESLTLTATGPQLVFFQDSLVLTTSVESNAISPQIPDTENGIELPVKQTQEHLLARVAIKSICSNAEMFLPMLHVTRGGLATYSPIVGSFTEAPITAFNENEGIRLNIDISAVRYIKDLTRILYVKESNTLVLFSPKVIQVIYNVQYDDNIQIPTEDLEKEYSFYEVEGKESLVKIKSTKYFDAKLTIYEEKKIGYFITLGSAYIRQLKANYNPRLEMKIPGDLLKFFINNKVEYFHFDTDNHRIYFKVGSTSVIYPTYMTKVGA